ncbi:MAG: LysR substrate-binding domain-containing protein [Pseudomonadota bacterium]
MDLPNLNALRTFEAAARHLNFRRAAEELNVTQGAVAQQVRRLEADLGHRLFRRQARGLSLTEIGQDYHEQIAQGLGLIRQATRSLPAKTQRLTLSVTPSIASKWLVPRLSRFSEIHPAIELNVIASEDLANFAADDVDLAIRQGLSQTASKTQSRLLAPLNLQAVCSPAYAARNHSALERRDFASLHLIQDGHRHWERILLGAKAPAKRPIMQFNQSALAIDAAVEGQGLALAPALLITAERSDSRLVTVWREDTDDGLGFHIVHPIPVRRQSALPALIEWLMDEVALDLLTAADELR